MARRSSAAGPGGDPKTGGRLRKRLPWSYYTALGWGGKRVDEERARKIVERVGLDAANDLGETPLTVAAGLGRVEMVRWLLERGADVNDTVPGEHFKTALYSAAYWKPREAATVLSILIEAGANLEARNRFGQTALASLFINAHTDPLPLAAVLVEAGAEITPRVRELGQSWNAAAFQAFLAKYAKGPAGKK